MSKVFIEESTLSAIGDAIRSKTGGTELIAPLDMPTQITGIISGSDPVVEALEVTVNGTYTAPDGVDGYTPVVVNVPQEGAPTAEDLTFTGTLKYTFGNNHLNNIIKKYENIIAINNVTTGSYMFDSSTNLEDVSNLHIGLATTGSGCTLDYAFNNCRELKKLPTVSGLCKRYFYNIFANCYNLSGEEAGKFFSQLTIYDDTNSGCYSVFYNCYSVRNVELFCQAMHENITNWPNRSVTLNYNSQFYNCRALDEITNLYIPRVKSASTSNLFNSTFSGCARLKNMKFVTQEGGTPYQVQWKSQTIDLSSVGYASSDYFNNNPYSSGISYTKKVTGDAGYQNLKNDPDWYTVYSSYSRYNHDSAVETINSLPDTSAYLSTAGGTNTIKFKDSAGSKTDGGAINTLTETEIAVAAAKGWTVSLV